MSKRCFFLLGAWLVTAAAMAGEEVPLDKNFSFRLEPATPALPPTLSPGQVPHPRDNPGSTLKSPRGEVMPPGTRTYQFEGAPVYLIPI